MTFTPINSLTGEQYIITNDDMCKFIKNNNTPENTNTKLNRAIIDNDLKSVLILLNFGSFHTLNLAAHDAVTNNKYEILDLLLQRNCDSGGQYGVSLLHRACSNQYSKCVEVLLKNKVNLNCLSIQGDTPLHNLVATGNIDILKIMLQFDVNLNIRNRRGETPLRIALKFGHIKCATLLLNKGFVNMDSCDHKGKTSLHYAYKYNNIEAINLLIKVGANTTVVDNRGRTPKQLGDKKKNVSIYNI